MLVVKEAEVEEKEKQVEEEVVKGEGVMEEVIMVIVTRELGEDTIAIRELEVVMVLKEPKVAMGVITKDHLGVTRVSTNNSSLVNINIAHRFKAVKEDMIILKTREVVSEGAVVAEGVIKTKDQKAASPVSGVSVH